METKMKKSERHKHWRTRKVEIQKFLDKETRWGCAYLLRKYVLECMPPEKLRVYLRPKYGKNLNLNTMEAIRMVSHIEDLILPEMSSTAIRKWILNEAEPAEMIELIANKNNV